MIYPGTKLRVSDNSGAKIAVCIRILFCKRKFGNIGNVIKVSIKKSLKNSRVKKGEIYNSLIVNTKFGLNRKNGTFLKFEKNKIVILDNKYEFLGTRIFGIIPREFKNTCFSKIISLSKYVI